jgi:hypothetical protein
VPTGFTSFDGGGRVDGQVPMLSGNARATVTGVRWQA